MAAGRINWKKVVEFVAKWLGDDIADGMKMVYEEIQRRRQESTDPTEPPTETNLTGTLIHAGTSATTRTTTMSTFTQEELVIISALMLFALGSFAYYLRYKEKEVVADVAEDGDDKDEDDEGPFEIAIVRPCRLVGFSHRPTSSLVSYSHRVDDAGPVAADENDNAADQEPTLKNGDGDQKNGDGNPGC